MLERYTDGVKECLEKVQKRAVKITIGPAPGSYEDKLKKLGLTTLEERKHQLDTQQYKILHGMETVERYRGLIWQMTVGRE
jgi:fructose/tagatose bisphosphate aldolase